jgi:hypothetical protein
MTVVFANLANDMGKYPDTEWVPNLLRSFMTEFGIAEYGNVEGKGQVFAMIATSKL